MKLVHYEWAEPGDPPNPDYASVRSRPLAKPLRYPSTTPESERKLIRAYQDDGDLDALEQLVGAHRPMVVRMAKHKYRHNGTSLKALVEYGMLGVRLAAEPLRPSLTKKGKLVGFNPSNGNRFSTYARPYAKKEMDSVLADLPYRDTKPEVIAKGELAAETWWDREPPKEEDDDPLLKDGGHRILFRDLQHRRLQPQKCVRPWTLWKPTFTLQKPRLRNYRKYRVTATELACRDLFYGVNYLVLQTYEDLAAAGMDGWNHGKEDSHDLDDWWFPSEGAFKGKEYRLPEKVLRLRWRMGCKRDGKIIPFRANAGLGLFDRRGHNLPDYTFTNRNVVVIRSRQFIPFLCLYPLASIYLIGGEVNGVDGEIISWRRLWTMEHSRCLQSALRKTSNGVHYIFHQHSLRLLTRLLNADSAHARTSSAKRY